jgi:hypothetical protein
MSIQEGFGLGYIVITPGATHALGEAKQTAHEFVRRHAHHDWGEVEEADKAANDKALQRGGRLLSKYHTTHGAALYVITEADRSTTTILLPSEY